MRLSAHAGDDVRSVADDPGLRLTRDELAAARAKAPVPCDVCSQPVYRFGGMSFQWDGRLHNFFCRGYSGKA